jgi:hypothetical protein
VPGGDAFFGNQFLKRLENRGFTSGLLRSPPASFTSNSASFRVPAPKSTARNDLVFSIYGRFTLPASATRFALPTDPQRRVIIAIRFQGQ